MKVDILAFGAHPDDVEISCSGSLMASIAKGKSAAIVDLTQGELGTRGTAELRLEEAANAAKVLGIAQRDNLGLRDGWISSDEESQLKVIAAIRKYQPDVVLANAVKDRHPDHGNSAELIREAVFKSGLAKIITYDENGNQKAWRPGKLYFYIQDRLMIPDFVVDITEHWDQKLQALKAFKSQFHDPSSSEPETYISSSSYWKFLEARGREMGHLIGAEYGEGFISEQALAFDQIQ